MIILPWNDFVQNVEKASTNPVKDSHHLYSYTYQNIGDPTNTESRPFNKTTWDQSLRTDFEAHDPDLRNESEQECTLSYQLGRALGKSLSSENIKAEAALAEFQPVFKIIDNFIQLGTLTNDQVTSFVQRKLPYDTAKQLLSFKLKAIRLYKLMKSVYDDLALVQSSGWFKENPTMTGLGKLLDSRKQKIEATSREQDAMQDYREHITDDKRIRGMFAAGTQELNLS